MNKIARHDYPSSPYHGGMGDQERHHARLDVDKTEAVNTDALKAAWFDKWARRCVEELFPKG